MYRRIPQIAALLLFALLASPAAAAPTPHQTLADAARVLEDTRTLRVQSIPDALLKDAQAIAVIPNVVKVGLIVGGRHGRGVVVTRGADGAWSEPSFIELSGGSVGWQIGVQSTDVVLVFKNRSGIDNLLQGNKFTLGADAAVAAGPVGRQASAATDEQLKAEVYSYSRSRGLFAGVSLDGSVLSTDAAANAAFAGGGEPAKDDAARLFAALAPTGTSPADVSTPSANAGVNTLGTTQSALVDLHNKLNQRLAEEWRTYLALPPEVTTPDSRDLKAAEETLARYDRVAADTKYEALISTEIFQQTHATLGRYVAELQEAGQVSLPPPPKD